MQIGLTVVFCVNRSHCLHHVDNLYAVALLDSISCVHFVERCNSTFNNKNKASF